MVQMKGKFRTSCMQQHKVSNWHVGRVYAAGACVLDPENPTGGFSVCMKEHIASLESRPLRFPHLALMADTFGVITEVLTRAGLEVSVSLVLAFLPHSDVWWPLCKQSRVHGLPDPYTGCGNLATLEGEACMMCLTRRSLSPSLKLSPSALMIEQHPGPALTQQAVALLQRSFHADVTGLIASAAARTKWGSTNLNSCRLWCAMHVERGLVGALLWRCVCTDSKGGFGARMLEVLFLATREDMANIRVAEEVVSELLTYARVNSFDLLSVAAVPAQGIAFWTNNGLSQFATSSLPSPTSDSVAVSSNPLDAGKHQMVSSFLRANMLMFPDTPLFARVL